VAIDASKLLRNTSAGRLHSKSTPSLPSAHVGKGSGLRRISPSLRRSASGYPLRSPSEEHSCGHLIEVREVAEAVLQRRDRSLKAMNAMSRALSVGPKDIDELKHRHGNAFFNIASQAEVWIATPREGTWSHEWGQRYIDKLKRAAECNEEKYCASLLVFKDTLVKSEAFRRCLPHGSEIARGSARVRDPEAWCGGSYSLEVPLSPKFRQISAPGARKHHDAMPDTHSSMDSDVSEASLVKEVGKRWRRTQLAALLEGLRHSPNSDLRIEAVLGDGVDEVLRTSHAESQRHLPNAEDLLTNLGGNQRESILEWLVQACDIMRLPDAVLYSTVLLLDRYCTVAHEPLPMERMQKVLMAVICTVLKTCAIADEVTMPLRELLLHLCRGQVVFEEILVMEHRVLQTLQFTGITSPTVLDFLEALGTPLHICSDSAESALPIRLAKFLIELSLFHASVHYRRPHLILAAASLYVALCSCRSPPAAISALLQDVEAICWEKSDVPAAVVTCATELHSLWHDFAALQGHRVQCLLRKFSGSRLQAAVLLHPPAALHPPASTAAETPQRLRWSSMPPIPSTSVSSSESARVVTVESARVLTSIPSGQPTMAPIGLNRWAASS
jgi:hypothetical protein